MNKELKWKCEELATLIEDVANEQCSVNREGYDSEYDCRRLESTPIYTLKKAIVELVESILENKSQEKICEDCFNHVRGHGPHK